MDYVLTNLVLEIFCFSIVLVLIICQLTSKNKKERENKIFLLVLIIHFLMISFDISTWLFDGNMGSILYYLSWIMNYFSYSFSILDILIFVLYITACIKLDKQIERKIFLIAAFFALIAHILLIISFFNGMIYTIDRNLGYVLGKYYWLMYLYAIIILFLSFLVVIKYRKKLQLRTTLILLTYSIIPMLTILISIKFHNVLSPYAAITISFLIVFVNMQYVQEEKIRMQEQELMDSRISIMLSQIQPHFLFNTLTAIDGLVYENERAHDAIFTFSKYLRFNMDSLTQKELIPFHIEFEHTKQYLSLEKLRFLDKLNILYDIKVTNFHIPVLTLQPIVENAIRYGITKKRNGGTLKIETNENDNEIIIIVSDDGVGFSKDIALDKNRSHIGIINVTERLKYMCNGTLSIESVIDKGTNVKIIIPKKVK